MISRSPRVPLRALSFLALAIYACAPSTRFHVQYGPRLTQTDLDKILAENPLAPGENLKVFTLGRGQGVSHHIVQIRDREIPHIHKFHDLTVIVLGGRGYIMWEQRRIDLKAGDVLFIPRGLAHYYVNGSEEPAVAFAIYSPPFDGKDTIPVGQR